jgi:hypothetical protein
VLSAAHCAGAFIDGVFIGGTDIFGSGSEYVEVLQELPNPSYGMFCFEIFLLVNVLIHSFLVVFNADPREPDGN